jgi:hypothetical protein
VKDFFVSYNSADRTWAEWIAWVLEEQGYTVVIQAWDFRPGGNFILDMQRATAESERTILVLSDAYLQAQYTQPEWAAAFRQDPTATSRRLLPIRVAECQPTGMLGPLVYVDLVGKSETEAEQLVLAALQERAKPTTRPSFPGSPPAAERVTPQKAVFPGAKPMRVKWQIVLEGELSNTFDDSDLINRLIQQLKELTQDQSLTCEKAENGSIVLTLKGTEEGFKVIEALFKSGQLTEICGLHVEYVGLVSARPTSFTQAISSQSQNPTAQIPSSRISMTSQPSKITALGRLQLIKKLNGLPPSQFEELLGALNPPAGIVPGPAAGQGARTAALLQWVEGSTGRGLAELEAVYDAIASHP